MLYPLDIFHCERQTTGSNFKMTTLGFELFSARHGELPRPPPRSPPQPPSPPPPSSPPLSPSPPLPTAYPGDLNAWYCPGAFDIAASTWQDCSGNGKTATLSGSGLAESRSAGHGGASQVLALSGTTSSTISSEPSFRARSRCARSRGTLGAPGR